MIVKCDYFCNWCLLGSYLSCFIGLLEDWCFYNKNRSFVVVEFLLIIGFYLFFYVCKVLVLLELKGIVYCIDFIVLFFGDEVFECFSLLCQILVLVDGDFVFNDFSVICQYLEECYLQLSLYFVDIGQCVQVCWLEEYVDLWLGQVIIWQLFYQLVINCGIWQCEFDQVIL